MRWRDGKVYKSDSGTNAVMLRPVNLQQLSNLWFKRATPNLATVHLGFRHTTNQLCAARGQRRRLSRRDRASIILPSRTLYHRLLPSSIPNTSLLLLQTAFKRDARGLSVGRAPDFPMLGSVACQSLERGQ